MKDKNIDIIGAGVAGLAIGWRLRQAGYNVTIYERGRAGMGASHAAAGMLAASIEAEPGEDSLLRLNLEAQRMWPGFAEELRIATFLSVGYRESGTLFMAPEQDDLGHLEHRYEFLRARGLPIEWCEGSELQRREPYLRPRVRRALYSPHDHQADNRALTIALLQACKTSGITIREQTGIDEIVVENGVVTGLRSNDQLISTREVIICAGAWSSQIKGIPEECRPPVFPMKGQMLALQMDTRLPLLKHVVWTPRLYMVPRDDGRLIVGATMEDKGFDASLTGGGMLHLLRECWEILPGMEELPLVESWAGFRPTSRDDAPIIGPSGIKGLTYATGQHRNGILLTPLLADLVRDYIRDGQLPKLAQDFSMKRFMNAQANDQR